MNITASPHRRQTIRSRSLLNPPLKSAFMMAFAGFLLAGCTFGSDQFVPCPNSAILKDASRITLFRPGQGRNLEDLQVEAALYRTATRCEATSEGVEVETWMQGEALIGPQSDVRKFALPFFMSVIDKQNNIIQKEVFDIELEFEEGTDRISFAEWLAKAHIPLPGELLGTDFEVVIGIQLTQAQLEYNRSQQGQ